MTARSVTMTPLSRPVYVGEAVDINGEENSKLRKYAEILRARLMTMFDVLYHSDVQRVPSLLIEHTGKPPFDMVSAAECIEDLANNVVGRSPLLDVHALGSWSASLLHSSWRCFETVNDTHS